MYKVTLQDRHLRASEMIYATSWEIDNGGTLIFKKGKELVIGYAPHSWVTFEYVEDE